MSDPGPSPPGARVTRLMPFGVLLDQAMSWTRRYLRRLVLPFGAVLAILNGLLAAVQAGWLQGMAAGDTDPAPGATVLGGCALPILTIAVLGATWLVYSCLCVAATHAVAGREVSARESCRFVLALPRLATIVLAGVLTGVSYLCCVVPLFYVGPLLSLTVPAMAEEGLVGGAALSRSSRLIRHNPKRRFVSNPLVKAFVLFVVAILISVLMSLATAMPFQIVQQWMTFREAGAVDGTGLPPVWVFWLQVPASVISAFVSTAAWLYASFGLALHYFDTRKRKEGMDLEEAIAALDRERLAGDRA